MSKVTITEPVGYLYQTGPHKVVDLRLFDEIPQNTIVSALITTTQAEAYADARVREALGEILTISLDARHISDIENKISEMLGGLK